MNSVARIESTPACMSGMSVATVVPRRLLRHVTTAAHVRGVLPAQYTSDTGKLGSRAILSPRRTADGEDCDILGCASAKAQGFVECTAHTEMKWATADALG